MHLGNGAVTPECGLIALGAASVGAGIGVWAAKRRGMNAGQVRLAGALGAVVFAAQLFNVQILPYSSVHLVGGVLLAWALGPPLGMLAMSCVLLLQAVMLGDGGLLALGVNIFNMAILPALGVACVQRYAGESYRNRPATIGMVAALCTVAAAGLIPLEVAVGRGAGELQGWSQFAMRMIVWHSAAALLEGIATFAAVGLLGWTAAAQRGKLTLSYKQAAMIVGASLLVALLSVPSWGFASGIPDGYQTALQHARDSSQSLGILETQLAGLPAQVQAWQEAMNSMFAAPEALLLVAATAAAGLLVATMSWFCRPKLSEVASRA